MVEWLQYIGEPSELVLAWQAGDRTGVRFRWAVATVRREGKDYLLSYLDADTEFPIANEGRKWRNSRSWISRISRFQAKSWQAPRWGSGVFDAAAATTDSVRLRCLPASFPGGP
jgi:hypothetical protein